MAAHDDYSRAQELYAAGQLDDAERLLAEIVGERPDHGEALLLLGLAIARRGRPDDAVRWIERARDLDPNSASVWQGLGLLYRQLGRLDDSLAAYDRAIAIDARGPAAYVNAAVALRAQGDLARAVDHLERAIALAPGLRPAYFNLGNCLVDLREFDRAGAAYLQCLRLNPRDSEAALGVARVFREQRRHDMAEKALRAALKLAPEDPDIAASLGATLHDRGKAADARTILEGVLARHPGNARALTHLGDLERHAGDLEQAEALYRRALAAIPHDSDVMFNLADVLSDQGRAEDAVDLIGAARALAPNNPETRYRCGMALLGAGEFVQGWDDYAWRVKTVQHRAVRFCHLPRLEALRFDGRKVVLWGDQGIGDEILYASFLLDLRAQAPNIVCEVDSRLVPLLRRGLPEFCFVGRRFAPTLPRAVSDDAAQDAWRAARLDTVFDGATHQLPLPDLGPWLRRRFEDFPVHRGYLRADPARIAAFQRWLARRPGERVIGISWISRNPGVMRYKSLDLQTLIENLPRDGVRLVNLQYGDVAAEIAEVERATGRRIEIAKDLDCFSDIDGLAALIMACDAVITVSTATVHIAGALGVPTALLSSWALGKPWYWFRFRADCPWYPSVRIVRQSKTGDWRPALAEAGQWLAASL